MMTVTFFLTLTTILQHELYNLQMKTEHEIDKKKL